MHCLSSVDYFLLNSNAVPRSVSDINLSIMTFKKKKTRQMEKMLHLMMKCLTPQLRLIYYTALDQDSKVFSTYERCHWQMFAPNFQRSLWSETDLRCLRWRNRSTETFWDFFWRNCKHYFCPWTTHCRPIICFPYWVTWKGKSLPGHSHTQLTIRVRGWINVSYCANSKLALWSYFRAVL